MHKSPFEIVRRWVDCDGSVTQQQIRDTLLDIQSMANRLTSLDSTLAHAVIDFYSDNSTQLTDARPVRELLAHKAPSVERSARERLILTFHDADAVFPLIDRLRKSENDEDLMSFAFVLKCVLANEEAGFDIARKIAKYVCNHPLAENTKEKISFELAAQGFDPTRIF